MPPEPNTGENKIIPDNIDGVAVVIDDVMDAENSDSSDDGIETEYAGYKLLQQDEIPNGNIEQEGEGSQPDSLQEEQSSIENENLDIDYQNLQCSGLDDEFPTGLGFPEIEDDGEETSLASVEQIEMNENQALLVKNAMAGFSLPETNVPEWAKSLSDDQWSESLETTIKILKNT